MTEHLSRPHSFGPGGMKLSAMVLLAVPAVILLLFAVGEMAGGDATGAQHIPEAGLLLLLIGIAWRYPRAAGWVLIYGGGLLFVAYISLVVFSNRPDVAESWGARVAYAVAALVLFVPPVLAGWLLLRSTRETHDA